MTIAQSIQHLRDAFPREEFPDRTVALYGQALQHLPPETVERAISNLIRSRSFLPRVAEILNEVAELELNLPTTEEAWEIANRGSLRAAHQCVRDAAEHVGGRWTILHSDNVATVRAQFRVAYEHLCERVIAEYRTGHAHALPDGLKPLGKTMAELPVTTQVKPRPVNERLVRRWLNPGTLEPPSEEEKADAIEVLREEPLDEHDPMWPIYQEAERILAEAGK